MRPDSLTAPLFEEIAFPDSGYNVIFVLMNARLFRFALYIIMVVQVSFAGSLLADGTSKIVRSLSVDEGLSQSMVYCIIQDSRGFMWFGTQDGLNLYDGHAFKVFKYDPGDPLSIGSNQLFCAYKDPEERLWFGTERGIYIFNPHLESFSCYDASDQNGTSITSRIRCIFRTAAGDTWMVGDSGKLYKINPNGILNSLDVNAFLTSGRNVSGENTDINRASLRGIAEDADGGIWIAASQSGLLYVSPWTNSVKLYDGGSEAENITSVLYYRGAILVGTVSDGVLTFDAQTGTFSEFLSEPRLSKLYVRKLMAASDGRLWIGTESGAAVFDPISGKTALFAHVEGDNLSLSDNAVHSLAEDSDGGIWIGTYFGGVNYVSDKDVFRKFYPVPGINSISGKRISEFCEDENGDIWIATEDAGLNRYVPVDGKFYRSSIPATNVHALLSDGARLYVGTFSSGLYVVDIRNRGYVQYHSGGSGNALLSNDIYSLYKDSSGRILVGTSAGLNVYYPETSRFESINPVEINKQVNEIKEDCDGNLWLCVMGGGVWKCSKNEDCWTHYDNDELLSATSMAIFEDGRIYVGTNGNGIFLYSASDNVFEKVYDHHNGLLNDVIYSLVIDKNGKLWGSTNKGLFRIGCGGTPVSCYTKANGLLSDQFNFKSGFMSKEGVLYFGGISGYISFAPETLDSIPSRGTVIPTDFLANNREVKVEEGRKPLLKGSIAETSQLVLPSNISNFSIRLTEINYSSSVRCQYLYKLEGWDKLWMPLDLPSRIGYSNLDYGEYRLRVRPADSQQDVVSIKIRMKPPFLLSYFAKVIYVLLLITAFLTVVWEVRRRFRKEQQRKNEKLEEAKYKEIYEAKIGFFANITHELRTPLTLIKLPLTEIIEKTDPKSPEYANLLTVRDNADRLMNLVNQLLDFRKLNMQTLKPCFINSDVRKIVDSVVSRFLPSAKIKGITVNSEMSDGLFADVDAEMLVKIVSNLMNNALKHAQSLVSLSLQASDTDFLMTVRNDGDRIPASVAEEIFTPFFQIDRRADGFGVGLALVKSLCDLHSGSVKVYEDRDMYTCFEVKLPLVQQDSFKLEKSKDREIEREVNSAKQEEKILDGEKKVLLAIDDDVEFLEYISRLLEAKFRVIRATTGSQGLELLSKMPVDIVLSDIVMPGTDGLALCRRLREEPVFRNIPVILMSSDTASSAAKAEAYEAGADYVLDKPFYFDFLTACINNIFKTNYISSASKFAAEEQPANIVFTKADDGFVKVLIEMIENHLEDADLDINKLSSMMNMSRATLYRKTSEVLRATPNDFIRMMRLKKAAELLRQKEYRVNEIAYIVGFSSPSYFSKCFFKYFGVLPKDFK